MNKWKKQFCFLMCLSLMPIIGCGCQNKTMSIKYSEYKYKPAFDSGAHEIKYTPQPDSIILVKTKVITTKPSFIKSQSFPTETKTLFQLIEGESIPQKPSVKKVHVSYYESHSDFSLRKGDTVELLFDSQGNFVDIRFPSYIYDRLPQPN